MALDAHAPVECPPEDTVLDCTGRLVTPSFGCGHHHIYSALARGMPPAPKAPANFLEVLEYEMCIRDRFYTAGHSSDVKKKSNI